MDPFAPYQTELVKIADRLASRAEDGDDPAGYLRRFRVVFRHLSASVVGMSLESGVMAMQFGMGMGPNMPQPDASAILLKTDEELKQLSTD